jgi:hypothetical protein
MLKATCCHIQDRNFSKGFNRKKKQHENLTKSKKVIILGFGPFSVPSTPYIFETTRARSNLVE